LQKYVVFLESGETESFFLVFGLVVLPKPLLLAVWEMVESLLEVGSLIKDLARLPNYEMVDISNCVSWPQTSQMKLYID